MKTWKTLMLLMVLMSAAVEGWGATVQIQCGDAKTVAGAEVSIFKIETVDRHEKVTFVKKEKPMDSASQDVQVDPGKYLFVVQGKNKEGIYVLLSSGATEVKADTKIVLTPLPPQELSLSYQKSAVAITKASLRADREPADNAMAITAGAKVIIAKGQTVWARISAKNDKASPPVYAELWQKVSTGSLALDLESEGNCICRFNWLGDKKMTVQFYPPAAADKPESYSLPVTKDTIYVTNRKFVEISYSYPIPEGTLVVQRNSHMLNRKTYTFELGGPFEPCGYARFFMKSPNCLLWDVDLINANGDMVDKKASSIQWQVTLTRRDGKPVPANTDAVTDDEMKSVKPDFVPGWGGLFDQRTWRDWEETLSVFEMEVSYTMNGQTVKQKVRPEPMSQWNSTHITIDVPRRWIAANARAYVDKLERFYQYCMYLGVEGQVPENIHMRLTGVEDHGFSTFGKRTNIQLAFQHMRTTLDFYTSRYAIIQIHEYMHSFGHVHGPVMDKAIKSAYFDYYCNHGKYLEEHPEYLPEPVAVMQDPIPSDFILKGLRTVDKIYEVKGKETPEAVGKIRAELVALSDKYGVSIKQNGKEADKEDQKTKNGNGKGAAKEDKKSKSAKKPAKETKTEVSKPANATKKNDELVTIQPTGAAVDPAVRKAEQEVAAILARLPAVGK